MFRFVPKNEEFFESFDKAANNILKGARLLVEIFDGGGSLEEKVKLMKEIEHDGDKITHETVKKLNRTFVTPIDREDIYSLICGLDDVMDHIDAVAGKYFLYKLKDPTQETKELAAILLKSAEETVRAITGLEKFDKIINHVCIELNSLENEVDRITRSAIASLFDELKDPFLLIKWKEIYETFENAADRFEDVANILESIVVKHA